MELVKYFFTVEGSDKFYLLSGHLNQDPIENYFGQQRAAGGRMDNPSVKQVLENSMSIKQQGSMALMPVRGNSSRKRLLYPTEVVDETPLSKRQNRARSTSK